MRKIFFSLLFVFVLISENVFALTYEKKNSIIKIPDQADGRSESEGFYLNGVGGLPNCKKLNTHQVSILRQGIRISYTASGKLHATEKGLFDCMMTEDNVVRAMLYEGLIINHENSQIQIHFKNDNSKSYIYIKDQISYQTEVWSYLEKAVEFIRTDSRANTISRLATTEEIQHAKKLYLFYLNIDVSSPDAKKYNTINEVSKSIASQNINNRNDNNIYDKKTVETKKTKILESRFSKKCEGGLFSSGYKKGTKEFDDCINREEKLAVLEEQKLQIINEEKNKKVQQQKDLDQAKIREEQIKVSKMKPEDRYAYTCNEKFGFRKGSDKFKDCIFELYKAETELEKLELQKQVAKANADAARANAEAARAGAERQERLALAQTEAAKMQALAARQQAIAANTADSLALIESGLRMMSPQRPAPRMQTSCTYVGRFLNCF